MCAVRTSLLTEQIRQNAVFTDADVCTTMCSDPDLQATVKLSILWMSLRSHDLTPIHTFNNKTVKLAPFGFSFYLLLRYAFKKVSNLLFSDTAWWFIAARNSDGRLRGSAASCRGGNI